MNEAISGGMRRTILFVGQIPPPIHGFSLISSHVLNLLRGKSSRVYSFDVSPRSTFGPALAFARFVARRTSLAREPVTLYLALSGGPRQLLDLCFLIIARLFGDAVAIHHHSFSYIHSRKWYSRILFGLAKGCLHVALCDQMKSRLATRYDIPAQNFVVLSNAAFVQSPSETVDDADHNSGKGKVRIGFLGNVTEQKGIFRFLDTVALLSQVETRFTASVAGPIDPGIFARVVQAIESTPNVTYIGPVYDVAKIKYLKSIDILLFPTEYLNEAEPVVIHEAMAAGVLVFANARGCICEQVNDGLGAVNKEEVRFASSAVDYIVKFGQSQVDGPLRRRIVMDEFCRRKAAAEEQLLALFDWLEFSAGDRGANGVRPSRIK